MSGRGAGGPPRRAEDDDSYTYVQVRLLGSFKNEIIDHCDTIGVKINTWIVEAIKRSLRNEMGIPEPPPAAAALPSADEQLRSYLTGEKLTTPCGKIGSCTATLPNGCNGTADATFCNECGIRVI